MPTPASPQTHLPVSTEGLSQLPAATNPDAQFALLDASMDKLCDMVPFAYHLLNLDGTYLRINETELAWLGCSRDELINKRCPSDFFSAHSQDLYKQAFPLLMRYGHVENLEFELTGADGKLRQVLLFATLLKNTAQQPEMIRSVLYDITEQRRLETAQRIAAIVFQTHEGILITDANTIILRVNPAFTQLTGYSETEAIGQRPSMLQSGRHGQEFYRNMWAQLKQDGYWQGEMWNKHKNGRIYAEWLTVSSVVSQQGETTHYVGTFSDITTSKEAAAEIHRLAYYDALTKLPNRTLLNDRLHQALASSQRNGNHGALLFLDLDNFKKLNDTLGHAVGDLMLSEVASRLLNVVRAGDTVSRLGGDEFVVMLENLSANAAEAANQASLVGDKILKVVAQTFQHEHHAFYFTASIGISLFHGYDVSPESLFKQADLALYKVKSSGRNALGFFAPAMQTTQDQRSELESELHNALKQEQLRLYYQPQVDAHRRIIGAEVLLRWSHPQRGMISPLDFIPLAEDTGLIMPIGQWVISSACAQLKAWSTHRNTRDLVLAVNVSSQQFNQADFAAQVRHILAASCANPARLKIELTESIFIDNTELVSARMLELQQLGVSFSMDDFGTGFSSLSYLKRLPLDQLKIDRSFINELVSDPNDAAIVNTILTMGRTLGLHVIAEGVETEEQLLKLKTYGCSAYQGFLFSHPVPLEQFEQLLDRPSWETP